MTHNKLKQAVLAKLKADTGSAPDESLSFDELVPFVERSNHKRRLRGQDGYFGAKKALGTSELASQERMPVKITFVAPDARRRDIDNMLACIKPQLDGIAQALRIDDSRFRPITLDDGQDVNKVGFLILEVG